MKINSFILLNLLFFLNISCQESKDVKRTFIPAYSNKIYYEGRIGFEGTQAKLYWPGSQIVIRFKGTGISGVFQDDKAKNFYNVFIDDDSVWIFKPGILEKEYVLASGLPDNEHTIRIYKRTEWNRGTTTVFSFRVENGGEFLEPPKRKKRKMEFYGNSITAGYGVMDFSGTDRPDSIFTNNYLTYAAFTARHFNAESHYIVRSGIGIMLSWVPQTMPEIYDRVNPHDEESKWGFSMYEPDIVVINLFQNDAYLVKMPHKQQYKKRFGDYQNLDDSYIIVSYISFVQLLRKKYPKAHIICMLGNMSIMKKGSPWPGYVQSAVDAMDDPRVYTLFIPYKNSRGHPRVNEQKQMAEELIEFIEKNIEW